MVDVGRILSIVFTGLVVVFISLVLLIVVIWFVGKINSRISGKSKKSEETKDNAVELSLQTDLVKETQTESDFDKATVAAITAAIVSYRGGDNYFKIKNIKYSGSVDNAWKIAGLTENTRPF